MFVDFSLTRWPFFTLCIFILQKETEIPLNCADVVTKVLLIKDLSVSWKSEVRKVNVGLDVIPYEENANKDRTYRRKCIATVLANISPYILFFTILNSYTYNIIILQSSYLRIWHFCTDVVCFIPSPAAPSARSNPKVSFPCFFSSFSIFLLWFNLLQWPKEYEYNNTTQRAFSAAKYTWLHSSLVIFLMAPVQSCCKVSPGQILSLPFASTALIPLAWGHS